jgi:hypothetical protein
VDSDTRPDQPAADRVSFVRTLRLARRTVTEQAALGGEAFLRGCVELAARHVVMVQADRSHIR